MPARVRPTSPHLQIYRWQIGNSLSILHRATGVALAFGLVALCYWLVSLAGGERSYVSATKLLASPVGLFGLAGWTFAFLYHLLNGVRHLFWDAGYGFERTPRHVSGWFAVAGALGLTLCVWALAWHFVA
ncbi:MAG: succinate dehydrogenase / fumarate reductase, cytochrome b subunit [Gammaproteobacteria bacterium]|jgi:succinate dehydrogenase / fumarate reductase cytochrome b subunit|nr:succinate dehydrogenase / fumarate reductase, cytochrome b subunit [Gammaproteobacteria bacterium]